MEASAKKLGLDFTLLRRKTATKEVVGLTASLSCNTFLIDVVFNIDTEATTTRPRTPSNGDVMSPSQLAVPAPGLQVTGATVTRTLTSEMEASELGGIGLARLQRGSLQGSGLLRDLAGLTDQDQCFRFHDTQRTALAGALLQVEQDLLQMGQLEVQASQQGTSDTAIQRERVMLSGHGLVTRGFGAVCLEYWASPQDRIQHRALRGDGERLGTYAGHLVMESASAERRLHLGTCLGAKAKPALPLAPSAFVAEPSGGELVVAAEWVLRLDPPVVMASSVAAELQVPSNPPLKPSTPILALARPTHESCIY